MNNQSQSEYRYVVDIWNRQVTDTKTNKQTVEGVPMSSLLKTAIRLNMTGQATYTVSSPTLAEATIKTSKQLAALAQKAHKQCVEAVNNREATIKKVTDAANELQSGVTRGLNSFKQRLFSLGRSY